MKHCSILSLVPLLAGVLCSIGDRLGEFVECNRVCRVRRGCEQHGGEGAFPDDSPFAAYTFVDTPAAYRALLWDCSADCDYQCQQAITHQRLLAGEPPVQFHGKWPFVRMLGMQEFFASLFSVANFVPHLQGYRQLRRELARAPSVGGSSVLLRKYQSLAVVGMLAWISSAVFHARDMPLTEKLDYFFAGATVLAGFHALYIRVRRLDLAPTRRRCFSLAVLLVFVLHIVRLYRNWNYTYNMRFNICFGLLQYLLLLLQALQNFGSLRRQRQKAGLGLYAQQPGMQFQLVLVPVLLVLYTGLAMSSELFDFFSYHWQIDSHALWHFLTVAPSFMLYDFFLKDYRYLNTLSSHSAPE